MWKIFKRTPEPTFEETHKVGNYIIGREILTGYDTVGNGFNPKTFKVIKGAIEDAKNDCLKINGIWYSTHWKVGALIVDDIINI